MNIVRRSRSDVDTARLLADLAAQEKPSEAEIEAHAREDGDAWTDADFADAVRVYPPPPPEVVKTLRDGLHMSQARFARCFGFSLDAIQQYEQGRRRPSGPAATLLRVIAADPAAVIRALAG